MTPQALDPRSLLDPKPGWSEHLGRSTFRVVLSHDEVRVAQARAPTGRDRAFGEFLEARLARGR